jgi:hypothetical protein
MEVKGDDSVESKGIAVGGERRRWGLECGRQTARSDPERTD